MKNYIQGLLLVHLLLASQTLLALDIQAQGLFKGAAVLTIDGKQRMLKTGQRSPEGVALVAADPKRAIVEIEGEHLTLTLSRRITTNYNEADYREISIRRNSQKQYMSKALFNGRSLTVLVDTGANAVAMNSRDADYLGIDYEHGSHTRVGTASGMADAYVVTLRSVNLGGIKVSNVKGFVIDGGYPEYVLLGMTFLEHVDLREEGGILYLKGKY